MSTLPHYTVWWVLWAVSTLDLGFVDFDNCDADFDKSNVESIVAKFGFS